MNSLAPLSDAAIIAMAATGDVAARAEAIRRVLIYDRNRVKKQFSVRCASRYGDGGQSKWRR